jgi:hypothetical protein
MISSVRDLAVALIAAGFCLALGAPAQAGCSPPLFRTVAGWLRPLAR